MTGKSRRIVRAGLCDDVHWPFVQQEGTFFRGWLWNRIEPEATIRPMTLAGDWNLWRLMAGHAELVQAGRPLASFRVGPDQLSAVQAETYRAEIESILPEHVRRQAFEGIASGAPPTRLRLQSRFAAKSLSLVEEAVDGRRYTRFPDAFAANDVTPVCRIRMEGKSDVTEPVPDVQGQTGIFHRRRRIGCDMFGGVTGSMRLIPAGNILRSPKSMPFAAWRRWAVCRKALSTWPILGPR